ncbi:MAG: polyprenyl synthetase family protein [Cyclobacteriaceae bacterium]|nr:polyprenyl synthetase family protein [Cyclobacteriaceae bacterium]MCH8514700.1 polyprenyl synthetase family protein [Cyclobacteriaceae bacterium]
MNNDRITNYIQWLEANIAEQKYGESPESLYEPISYIMSLGGKRIRPLLVSLSHGLFSGNHEEALKPALAVEVFHNFTLMHDDIMDEAPLRRGKATVHERWNENTAILSGDVMLVKAYDYLLDLDPQILAKVIARFNRTAAEVCEGQQLDMLFETQSSVSKAEYIEMIRLKTAVLLGFSLELGARVAKATDAEVELIRRIGENLGIGFQLKDDLLDVYADQAKFGKKVGGDIAANKKTFLLLSALEKAQGDDLEQLQNLIQTKPEDEEGKIKAVRDLYDQLGIRELTEAKVKSYFDQVYHDFELLPRKHENYYHDLKELIDYVVYRDK